MTDMSKRRAMLIARNAPLQYSGALTRHHQKSAGIKQYRWQTSHDERVRALHVRIQERLFRLLMINEKIPYTLKGIDLVRS